MLHVRFELSFAFPINLFTFYPFDEDYITQEIHGLLVVHLPLMLVYKIGLWTSFAKVLASSFLGVLQVGVIGLTRVGDHPLLNFRHELDNRKDALQRFWGLQGRRARPASANFSSANA